MMDSYDFFMNRCSTLGIPVIRNTAIKNKEGLIYRCRNGKAVIFIHPLVGRNRAAYIGWHEMAHYFSPIYNDNQNKTESCANRWLAKLFLPPSKMVCAIINGCKNSYDMAEYLGYCQELVENSIQIYSVIYENGLEYKDWKIYFQPCVKIVNKATDEEYPI